MPALLQLFLKTIVKTHALSQRISHLYLSVGQDEICYFIKRNIRQTKMSNWILQQRANA